MPSLPAAKNKKNSRFETEKDADSIFLEEDQVGVVFRIQAYFRDNLSDIVILIILSGLTLINVFAEAKLTSLYFFYIVILITGYSLGKRFAVLAAFLTILIMWTFILADNSPYLVNNTRESLNFHMTIWSGFLILTGWLGSALAKSFHRETTDELFISPKSQLQRPANKTPNKKTVNKIPKR